MRIVAGTWRGRRLGAPVGAGTRPTADRVRQAVFDMLLHAPWGGRGAIEGALVLDAFAGTGALGLEALSRGAAAAVFLERDRVALGMLAANIAACAAEARCVVLAGDVLAARAGERCGLVFLDPPYGQGLIERAVAALTTAGWIGPGTMVVAETGRNEIMVPAGALLAERTHGAARVSVWLTG